MYSSNEFLHSAGVSRHMQATGETPSQKTSMKRRSCEVPLGDISTNNFKVSLGDITNENNYDCRSLRSIQSEDTRSLRSYRPIDSRSVKNFRSSLVDVSGVSTFSLSRPPSYDQLSRRSLIEGAEGQGITSSIEGVLWSDEEENEYFYHENITSAWNEDRYRISRNPRASSFRIPRDPDRARSWLRAINKEDLLITGYKRNAIRFCELHFHKSEYSCRPSSRYKVLSRNAVPSLNLSSQTIVEKFERRNKQRVKTIYHTYKKIVLLVLTPMEIVDVPPDPLFKFNIAIEIAHSAQNNYDIAMPSMSLTQIHSTLPSTNNNFMPLSTDLEVSKKEFDIDIIIPETPTPVASTSNEIVFEVRPIEFVNVEAAIDEGKIGENNKIKNTGDVKNNIESMKQNYEFDYNNRTMRVSNEENSVYDLQRETYVFEIKEESSDEETEFIQFV